MKDILPGQNILLKIYKQEGTKLKKLIGYIITWVLYIVGDIISKPMQWFDWAWLYPTYNRLMLLSYRTQKWAGNETPWRESK